MPDFLLEIGAEEIPDWMIVPALGELHKRFEAAFGSFGGDALRTDGTPRRLVLKAQGLLEQEPDTQVVVQGPYLSAGPKAAEGFARKNGVSVDQMATTEDAKGERYVVHQHVKGRRAMEALEQKLPEIIASLPFPKSMFWTGRGGIRFVRPIRWIVALLGDEIVPIEVAGVRAGNTTRGHRILGSKEPVMVAIGSYEQTLRDNFVIVDAEERRDRITAGLSEAVHHDPELLGTLTYLTEYPSVIHGTFEASYLQLPREILSTVMRHHQRYFSVLQPDGSLAPEFFAVTNTDGDPAGLIRQGNERVLRARFNDARFFWDADNRRKLSARVPDLAKVTFQAKLGTYKDKTERIAALAAGIAETVSADANTVSVAALLCKCDLTTDMVKEFTDLQGVVGGLYAEAQGEGKGVAQAVYDHYKPVSMEDSIPRTLEGQVLSIADKLDTLRECFRIGLIPTGSKDPFALRRAAQGIVKILFEARLALPLTPFAQDLPELVSFLGERINFYLREFRSFAYDEVNAAMAAPWQTLADLFDRVDALHYIRPTEDFEPLAASSKRIKNILSQAGFQIAAVPDEGLLQPGPEADLYKAFVTVRTEARAISGYREKLTVMASLRPAVDLFFDTILVNDPNPAIRQNRLALLSSLLAEFSTIADFSEIVTEGTAS